MGPFLPLAFGSVSKSIMAKTDNPLTLVVIQTSGFDVYQPTECICKDIVPFSCNMNEFLF